MGIGDWGLGIGDWGLAQSPIPNPHNIFFCHKLIIIYKEKPENKIFGVFYGIDFKQLYYLFSSYLSNSLISTSKSLGYGALIFILPFDGLSNSML